MRNFLREYDFPLFLLAMFLAAPWLVYWYAKYAAWIFGIH